MWKTYLTDFWLRFRDAVLTPARIVPLVLTVVGAGVSLLVGAAAKQGLNLDPAATAAVITPFALGAVGIALNWQVGNQKYEEYVAMSIKGDLSAHR